MIVDNGRKLISACMFQKQRGRPMGYDEYNTTAFAPVKTVDGTEKANAAPTYFMGSTDGGRFASPQVNNNMTTNGLIMRLGVDGTPVQASDIDLGNYMVNGVDVNTLIVCSGITTMIDANGIVCVVGIFTNTTNHDIEIKECGLFVCNNFGSGSADGQGCFILARSVVKTGKLVVEAGETVTFTEQLKYNSTI